MTIFVGLKAAAKLPASAAVAGLFGSDHASERAAAALKAHELVKQMGVTWADIVAPKSVPMVIDIGDSSEAKIGTILANLEALSTWEQRFVSSVNGRPVLSAKQRAIVARISRKVAAFRAARRRE